METTVVMLRISSECVLEHAAVCRPKCKEKRFMSSAIVRGGCYQATSDRVGISCCPKTVES